MISLETESYIINGKNERFFPFYELEYNEWIIYEDSVPKFYFELHDQVDQKEKVLETLKSKLRKGEKLDDLIKVLGESVNKKWRINSGLQGNEDADSHKSETIELEILNDELISRLTRFIP